jgi:hypothetical protein
MTLALPPITTTVCPQELRLALGGLATWRSSNRWVTGVDHPHGG